MSSSKPRISERLAAIVGDKDFVTYCALGGLVVVYLILFIKPVFLNDKQVMAFPQTVPVGHPIGADLQQMLNYSASFSRGETPYIGNNLYPPLATALFLPMLSLDFQVAFAIELGISLFAFVFSALIFPLWFGSERRITSGLLIIFLTGLFSYGLHFELERGQFNLLAFLFTLVGIACFQYSRWWSIGGYVLFTLAIQLKVYPALFVVFFVRDWRDWRANSLRWGTLGIINIALLFVLGGEVFQEFVAALQAQAEQPYFWAGNHSIRAFMVRLSAGIADVYGAENVITWIEGFFNAGRWILFAVVFGCFGTILLLTIRRNRSIIDPFLLFACAASTLLIPAVSHDYKLALLIGPAGFLLHHVRGRDGAPRYNLILAGLQGGFMLAYALTLYSFINKPTWLANNLPPILVMLILVTVMSLLWRDDRSDPPEKTSLP